MLSTSWESTGFLPNNKASLDISIRNHHDDQNYVNNIQVKQNDQGRSHSQFQQYPQQRTENDNQYKTYQASSVDKRATDLLDEMRHLSNQIDTLITTDNDTLNETKQYSPIISEERGVTKIKFSPTSHDYTDVNLLTKSRIDAIKDTHEIISPNRDDRLLTSLRTADDEEQSRTNIIDQTSVQKQIIRKLLFFFVITMGDQLT
jgi:hypothetical protein